MDYNPEVMGPLLKRARQTYTTFSQYDMAQAVGCSQTTIFKIESGMRSMTTQELVRYAARIGYDLSDIIRLATPHPVLEQIETLLYTQTSLSDTDISEAILMIRLLLQEKG